MSEYECQRDVMQVRGTNVQKISLKLAIIWIIVVAK